jgi:hypothetical protein
MEMELSFFMLYLVFLVMVFLVIIYFKNLLCDKAFDFEILSNFIFEFF